MLKDVRIPLAPIIPYIKEYLAQHETTPSELDREIGLPDDTLSVILRQRSKTIEFNRADQILCAIAGGLHTWWTDPELHRIYQSVDFSKAVEYDPETQFPCGHPRSPGNSYVNKRTVAGDPVHNCLACRNGVFTRRKEHLRGQLSLIREQAA